MKEFTSAECSRMKVGLLCQIAMNEPVIISDFHGTRLFVFSEKHKQELVGKECPTQSWSAVSRLDPSYFARDRCASLKMTFAVARQVWVDPTFDDWARWRRKA